MPSQEVNGKAFEYACIKSLYEKLSTQTEVQVLEDVNFYNTKSAFEQLSEEEQKDNIAAAFRGIEIITPLEPNLEHPDVKEPLILSIQPDKKGQEGDVRDVLCVRNEKGWNIGFSCKNNHDAVKHSRLSRTIDFGKDWLGYPVSKNYKIMINPLFDKLDELKNKKVRWDEVDNKNEYFYTPLLKAFLSELEALNLSHPDVPEKLLNYLLGRNDFYKIIKHTDDRITEVKAFNIYGTLGLSTKVQKEMCKISRLKMPTEILKMDFKKNSSTTIQIVCDNGWALSLRIHNASKWVEPSLKFDIQLIGVPNNMGSVIEAW